MKYRLLAALLAFGPAVSLLHAQIPFRTNEGYQLVDLKSKKPLNAVVFDEANVIGENAILVKKGEKKGVLDAKGSFVIRAQYPTLYKLGKYFVFSETEKGLMGIMDSTGNVLAEPAFVHIEEGNGKYFLAQVNDDWGNWGVIDARGKWIEKPVHRSVSMDMSPFPSVAVVGPHHIVSTSDRSGYYDLKDLQTGKVKTIRHDYAYLPLFEDGTAAVYGDKGSYLVKYDGQVVIPQANGEIVQSGPYALFFQEKQAKVYKKTGNLIGTFGNFVRGEGNADYIVLANDFDYLLMDAKGKTIRKSALPIELVGSGYYVYHESKDQQLLSAADGKTLTVPKNYKVKNYNPAHGLAILENQEGYQSVYDFNAGRFTVEGFYKIRPWKNELFVAEFSVYFETVVNGKTGEQFNKLKPEYQVTQWKGKYSIENKITRRNVYADTFDHAVEVNFHDSLFIVRIQQDMFVVNANQRKMSAPYEKITAAGNQFVVCRGEKCGLMSADMREVLPPSLRQIEALRMGNSYVYKVRNNRYGIVDAQGKRILDTVYNNIEERGNWIVFQNENGYGFLNKEGKQIAGLEGMYNYSVVNNDWISCSLPGKSALLYLPAEKIVTLPKEHYFSKVINVGEAADYFVVRKDYKHGLMDRDGKILVPAKYGYVSSENSPIRFLSSEDGAVMFAEKNGQLDIRNINELISLRDKYASEITIEARYALKDKSGNYVMVDENLAAVEPTGYKELFAGANLFIAKNLNGKYGALYDDGKEAIPFIYDKYDDNIWQYDAFVQASNYSLYDRFSKRVFENMKITGVSNQLSDYNDAYIILKLADGTQSIVYTETGEVVLDKILSVEIDEETFYAASYGETASVVVKMASGKGIYSLNSGKFLVDPVYDELNFYAYAPTESYLLKTKKNGKYNLYDLRTCKKLFGQDVEVIYNITQYDEVAKALSGNVLYVIAGNYDSPDMHVIQIGAEYKKAIMVYDYDIVFSGDPVIVVKAGKKKGLLKTDGNWLHKPELDSYEYMFDEEHMLVTKNKLVYILNMSDGTYFCQQGFEMIEPMGDYEGEFAIGYLNGKEYSINMQGQVSERATAN